MQRSSLWVAIALLIVSFILGRVRVHPIIRERSFIIIKPDGTERGLAPAIYRILETELGLSRLLEQEISAASVTTLSEHYEEHIDRDFFPSLMSFMQSGPIVTSIWEGGLGTVKAVRRIVGPTDPARASPETIRGRFGTNQQANVIHASDSVASAQREINIWFS